jgi:hypothetical protein
LRQQHFGNTFSAMKAVLKVLGITFCLLSLVAAGLFFLGGLLFRGLDPAQPKSGYQGDWRLYSELGIEE